MASSRTALRRVSLRNIAAHKVRLLLTILAVVLGTAFISGAFVFTASLNKAFDGALATAYDGVDVAVSTTAEQPFELDRATVEKLAHHPGVRAVNPTMRANDVIMTGADGTAIQTLGAPSMGLVYFAPEDLVGQSMEFTDGGAPQVPDEIVINATAAQLGNLQVRDNVTVVTGRGRAEVKVAGIVRSEADSTGWLSVLFHEDKWRELYTDGEHVDGLTVSATPDTDPAELANALAGKFPELTVQEGKELAEESAQQITEALSFVNYLLVAFGLIGLLVGAFIISNTFAMLVAQRTSEFALLRAIGTSRRQLTRTVLFEATIVGLIGSGVGVLAGLGLTKLLYVVMDAVGITLPGGGLTLTTSAVVVPIVIGLVITVLAAWAPAVRAGAIPPVEAMRSGDQSSANSVGRRTAVGAALALIAVVAVAWAMVWADAETAIRGILVGAGAITSVIAFWLAGPALARPLVGGLGRIFGAPFGSVGKLAATNSQRNPRRTAATSFALMLGLALVTSVGMLGTSMRASVEEWLESDLSADFILSPPLSSSVTMPSDVENIAEKVDGVTDTATLFFGPISIMTKEQLMEREATGQVENADMYGPTESNSTFFSGDVGKWYSAKLIAGSLDLSAPDAGVIVKQTLAEENGWTPGTELMMVSPQGSWPIAVTGIFQDTLDPSQTFIVSPNALQSVAENTSLIVPLQVYVDVAASSAREIESMRADLEQAVADYLIVQVMSVAEFSNVAAASINVMLGIVYGLLGLAVVISVLGIINTLALSIVERRQEIGTLRAIGIQRSEIRRMIRIESLQIAVFGAISGVLLGLALGWALLVVLSGEGLDTVVIPWAQIGIMLIGSAIVGVVAALWPAAQAAKTPPLAAISEE
ncbi:MAG: ABC transporter permease [Trueperella sp.]|nr:ABC transporter permease [Trueperella sp.]